MVTYMEGFFGDLKAEMYKRRLYSIGKWRSIWRPGGRNVKELAPSIRYTWRSFWKSGGGKVLE